MVICAVVVTYNGTRWVEQCFGSLLRSTSRVDVVAVDNGSGDGTAAMIREQFPGVDVIEPGENLGFGRANNLGIRRALDRDADYVFLLNQDAWVEPRTIENLVAAHREHPGFGVLSPVHLNGAGDALDVNFSHYLSPDNTPAYYSDLYFRRLSPIYETRFVNAAAWLISRECIDTIGGFDPLFFLYGEDDDYIQRVRFHGLAVGIVSAETIRHDREDRPARRPGVRRALADELIKMKRPDVSLARLTGRQVRTAVDRALTSVISGRFGDAVLHLAVFAKVLARLPRILSHRKVSRARGRSFL